LVWTTKDGTVKVGVTKKVPRSDLTAHELVPREIEGAKTDVVVIGPIVARGNTAKRRPCPGGFSCGHFQITAGTLGLWVKKGGEDFILSNNHVLANSNEATQGDWILQPGSADGGSQSNRDYIGRLSEFVVINHEGGQFPDGCLDQIPWPWKKKRSIEQPFPNLVDAALAQDFGGDAAVDPEIFRLGRPTGIGEAIVGEVVTKQGRTTELTSDPVEADDLSVQVGYGTFSALFEDQLMVVSEATPFSQGGDSGSAVLAKKDKSLVGLLFAGGQMEDGRDVTIVNKISHVQRLLGFEL
jgi:hypothetical protein